MHGYRLSPPQVLALVGAVCAAPLMLVFPTAMAAQVSEQRAHAVAHVGACALGVAVTAACTVDSLLAFFRDP